MGECIKHNGYSVKLGTCESLYYTNYQQYCEALKKGRLQQEDGNDTPENYINGSYRFRFPFPDENQQIGDYDDHDRGLIIQVPKSIGIEITHNSAFYRTDTSEKMKKIPALGFRIPCVQSDDFKIELFDWYKTKERTIFEIVQQKPVNGKLQLVVRCAYCGAMCGLDGTEMSALVKYIWQKRRQFTTLQVQAVIIAAKGYKTNPI